MLFLGPVADAASPTMAQDIAKSLPPNITNVAPQSLDMHVPHPDTIQISLQEKGQILM